MFFWFRLTIYSSCSGFKCVPEISCEIPEVLRAKTSLFNTNLQNIRINVKKCVVN